MTKQEIRERAEGIVKVACNLQRNYGLLEANGAVEERVISLYRAALEEAARASCWYCNNGNKARHADEIDYPAWLHEFDDGTEPAVCKCGPIHDLIAAMESEVKSE